MGYNAGGTYFENHRSSGFDTVANDVSCVVELTRSKRQAGGMMQTTGGIEIAIGGLNFACRQSYAFDEMLIRSLNNTFRDPVLPCPCTLSQARNDPRFMMDAMFRPNRPDRPNSACYIQRSEVNGTNGIRYTQQCCFAGDG